MAIIRWESMSELEKMFSDFPFGGLQGTTKGFMPAIDMYEEKDNVLAETALPGVDPKEVEITIENDVLTVKGGSKKESEVEEKNYYRQEVRSGSFYRQVAIPIHVLGEKAKAEYADGILKITMPKAPGVKAKRVKVAVVKTGKK